jgi:phosphoglycerol transferase MdoB-like AlkP superfamily enzyme
LLPLANATDLIMTDSPRQHPPLYPFFRYVLLLLGLLTLSRLLLAAWQWPRVGDPDRLLTLLGFGLRFDVLLISLLWFVPAVLLLLLPRQRWLAAIDIALAKIWLTLTTLLIVFLELATPAFIDQYDTRPNRLFFEYLETPVEVLRTSVLEYPWHFAAALLLMALLLRYLLRRNRDWFGSLRPWPLWGRLLALPLLVALLFIGGRSSFDHRPANASTAAFTNDQLVNKLALNSAYTVLYAAYDLRNEDRGDGRYGRMPVEQMLSIVRRESLIPARDFVDDPTSTWHRQKPLRPFGKRNLVIILQESLGAGFSKKLGGIGVTPEWDRLMEQGLWFSRLYATGTRSARGIEAVIAGYPPSASRSVLKLGLAQQRFVTLASILRQAGYRTSFIYGGESHFDNMAGFFLANGFDRVIDQNDYPNPVFRATWGVSDEDLFARVDAELQAPSEQPKFILAFTSSNHSPFEFPDGRIDLVDADKNTVNNAVRYADYALGRFFDTARGRDYFDDSYFLIVADHDTRVFGASLVPIDKFHIPGVIIGPDVTPREYDRPASQIDLAPTLLSLLGVASEHPMIGHDLLSIPPDYPGRALMQYGNNHAYLQGDRVVIRQPDKPPQQFLYREGRLEPQPLDTALAAIEQAHLLWPAYAYREGKYLYPPRQP